MAEVVFSVLGPISARDGKGHPIELGSPKQKAVLALLLIHAGEPLTPDQLIDGLWGDKPPDSAAATLQAYISNLRKAIEPDRPARAPAKLIVKNGGGYQISLQGARLDSKQFEDALDAAQACAQRDPRRCIEVLEEGLELWSGPAYADFRYEEFAIPEAMRLEEMKLSAIETRIGAELAVGRSADLIPEIEMLIGAHPLREKLWASLMIALYRSGRQAEALRAFRRCEAILAEELGIVPGEELRELELAILNQSSELLQAGDQSDVVVLVPEDQIVGREAERSSFARSLAAAKAGTGTLVLFEGEAGVGKTRLLESLRRDAESNGFLTAFARCVEVGGTPPFWPWAQLFRKLGPSRMLDAAGDYGRFLHPLLPLAVPESDLMSPSFRVAEGVIASLHGVSRETPVLLIIDDIYSADPDSLSVLTLLATELSGMAVVIACTHRGEKLTPESPLYDALPQLARLESVTRVALQPFDRQEVDELVQRVAATDVPAATVDTINERSGGNAFYAIELTRLLEAEQCLEPDNAAVVLPATVVDVIQRKLDRLSEDAVRMVRIAAVLGREFDVTVVGEAGDLDMTAVSRGVDEAVASGLIIESSRPGIYRFSHMIAVNSITHSLGSIRRAHIHEHLADALEKKYEGDPTRLVEIAHHRIEAAPAVGADRAIASAGLAVTYAVQSNALGLAEELSMSRHRLIMALPPSAKRDQLETESLTDLARIWTWREGYHSERLDEASRRLWELTGLEDGVVEFDGEVTSSDPALSAIQARFSYAIVSGDINTAEEVTRTSLLLDEANDDPMVRFAAQLNSLVVGVHKPDVANAVASAERALDALNIVDPSRSGEVWLPLVQQSGRVTLHLFSAWAYWLAGCVDRARQETSQARMLAHRLDHSFSRSFIVAIEGLVAAMDGSPEWVADSVEWSREATESSDFSLMTMWSRILGTWAEGMLGSEPHAHADRMAELLDQLEASGASVVQSLYRGMLAELHLRAGNPEAALEAIEIGMRRAQFGERFWLPELERLAGEAWRLLGDDTAADAAMARGRQAAEELSIVPLLARFDSVSLPA